MKKCEHRNVVSTPDLPYLGCVAGENCRASSHGNARRVEVCLDCKRERQVNYNQGHEEFSVWEKTRE
jgi:hypothetical protein